MRALTIRRFVLVTPYIQSTNDHEIDYFRERGFDVVHDVALGLAGGDEFIQVPPERWIDLALTNDRADSDGFLLACTNTTQIEAIEEIEAATGKPVVTATRRCCGRRSTVSAPPFRRSGLGRLPGRLGGHGP